MSAFRSKFNNIDSNTRILVVDNDPEVYELIRSHCDSEGIAVEACLNSDDLYSINIDRFALIIVDMSIDGDQGMSIIEQIKQLRTAGPDISVIACSVRMSPSTIINALNAGADDYLIKPFSPREMIARINSVLRRTLA